MDDEAVTTWQIDPTLRTTMRLGRVHRAMEHGEYAVAVIEAEELLDEEPDNIDALRVLAEAQLESGDAEGALQAFEYLLTLTPPDPILLSGLSIARFDNCDLVGAREAAREALRLDPAMAEGHYYLGLAQECLPDGRTEAIASFAAAQQLDPARYPFPLEVATEEWEPLIVRAMSLLPEPLQEFWNTVPMVLHDLPDLEELRNAEPPITPTVTGLYEGSPPEETDPWLSRPDSMRLFVGNLVRCASLEDLVEALSRTLEHEARDWLGVGEDELP